jgi:hypothetical protein
MLSTSAIAPVQQTTAGPGLTEPPHAYTITAFCDLNDISRPTYHKLKRLGLGPAEMQGGVVRISREAAAAWRAARESPTGEEALAVARDAETMRARSIRAARGAVASPHHVSRTRGAA